MEKRYVEEQATEPWRSFWLPLPDAGFKVSQFNDLLEWLGEDGCKYSSVLHANAPQTDASGKVIPGGFDVVGSTWADAAKLLKGNCSLTAI